MVCPQKENGPKTQKKDLQLKNFEENNIFHFFNINLDNLELKINEILNNYDYYYNLHNKKRKELLNKYNLDYHVKVLSDKINKSIKL